MTTPFNNIDVLNIDIKSDKKPKPGTFNLRHEITNFNKKQVEKKRFQTLSKSINDTNLGIDANNTQKLSYHKPSQTQFNFPKKQQKISYDAGVTTTQTSNIQSKNKLEPMHHRQSSNEPSFIEKR
jgi:hypothetical protein